MTWWDNLVKNLKWLVGHREGWKKDITNIADDGVMLLKIVFLAYIIYPYLFSVERILCGMKTLCIFHKLKIVKTILGDGLLLKLEGGSFHFGKMGEGHHDTLLEVRIFKNCKITPLKLSIYTRVL